MQSPKHNTTTRGLPAWPFGEPVGRLQDFTRREELTLRPILRNDERPQRHPMFAK